MPKFEFIEKGHKYLLDKVEIPSVTSVLPYNYTGDMEQAKLRGVYVHKAVELYNAGTLDEENLDPALKPYLESYKKAEKLDFENLIIDYKTGQKHPCTELQLAAYREMVIVSDIEQHEAKLYHPTYRYAGTIDFLRVGNVNKPFKVFALYLQVDGSQGKYEDHSKDLRKNIGIFLSFLTAYKWQKEKRII